MKKLGAFDMEAEVRRKKLKAAGFDGLIHERGGAPFLVMRRVRPLLLRQLAAAAAEQLSLAEAECGPDGVGSACASRSAYVCGSWSWRVYGLETARSADERAGIGWSDS